MTCGLKWFTPYKVPHECQRPEGHSGIHSCQCGEGLWPHEVDQAEGGREVLSVQAWIDNPTGEIVTATWTAEQIDGYRRSNETGGSVEA